MVWFDVHHVRDEEDLVIERDDDRFPSSVIGTEYRDHEHMSTCHQCIDT